MNVYLTGHQWRLVKLAATAQVVALVLAVAARGEPGIGVSWTFAKVNMDGTPLTDLAGAKVYYGTSSSNYTHVVDVPGGAPGETKTFRLSAAEHNLQPGVTYYLNGTAYNSAGLESDFCNEVTKSFQVVTAPAKLQQTTTIGTERWALVNVKDGNVWRRVWVRLD